MSREASRRLAAVWFADVVGYTELSSRDEVLALRVARELQRITRMECEARGGRVVKLLGDAVLTVFDSADGALRAAIGVRDGFMESPDARAAGVSLRVGLHLGDVAEAVDGDIYGDAVSAASRIEGAAAPGQVVMSSGTYELLRQRSALEVEDLGEHQLKELGLVRLYAASLTEKTESADLKGLLQAELAPLQMLDVAGFGGMGEIYLARDPRLHRTLAVKVLRSELVADEQARARFVREAQIIAGLSHPNIITIHSVGELEDGTPYFVMDYVEGGSLADRLEAEGALPIREASLALGQVASALEAAHARGVVHRDIKASNILNDDVANRVLVTDWGIAALDSTAQVPSESRLTQTGMVVGSPRYMSPEQFAGDEVGPETDVYALGLLAFELITGEGPFSGNTPRQLMISQLREDPPRLATAAEDVDDELDSLVDRCLAKTPADRPTARELARRLAGGGAAVLEWPPPGLQGLRRTSRRALLSVAVSSTLIALGLVLSGSLGAFSLRLWTGILVTALVLPGLGLVAGFVALVLTALTVRELRRGAELGYRWGTMVDVVADPRGDSGSLLAGAAEYAGVGEEERLAFLGRRRLRLMARVGAAVAPVPSLLLLAASRLGEGSGHAGLLLVAAALPTTALLALETIVRAKEVSSFREPRRRARSRKGLGQHLTSVVEAWRQGLVVVIRRHERASGLGRRDRTAVAVLAFLVASAVGGVLLMVPIFFGGVVGAARAPSVEMLGLRELQQRFDRARLVADWTLPPDSAISVTEASALVWALIATGVDGAQPVQTFDLPEWLGDARTVGTPLRVTATSDTVILMASNGLTAEQLAWVDRTRALPVFDILSRVARAPALDIFGARYPPPAPDSLHWAAMELPSYWRILELGDWKVLRAAAALSRGDEAAAELELRETISLGFLLMEQPQRLPNSAGARLVEVSGDALMTLYNLQGRTSAVVSATAGLSAMGERGRKEFGDVTGGQVAWVNDIVRAEDPTLAPGIRFETVQIYALFRSCMGVGAVLFGPGVDWQESLATAKASIRSLPGDREFFRMAEESIPRYLRIREPRQLRAAVPISRISGRILRNERVPACMLLASQTSW